jgi:hypothetical protein
MPTHPFMMPPGSRMLREWERSRISGSVRLRPTRLANADASFLVRLVRKVELIEPALVAARSPGDSAGGEDRLGSGGATTAPAATGERAVFLSRLRSRLRLLARFCPVTRS